MKINISLLLKSIGRIIDVKLLNAILDLKEHRVVLQFGIWRQTLVKDFLLELYVFSYFVFICIGIYLEALELLFVVSFHSSVIITFHF
jgi:hypothetical protein